MNVSTMSSRWLAIALSTIVVLSGVVAGSTSSALADPPTLPDLQAGQVTITTADPYFIRVGETVSVDLGTWIPEPASYEYQWYSDRVAIPGATGASYTVQDVTHLGTRFGGLYVQVTGHLDGYRAASDNSITWDVLAALPTPFDKVSVPTITGTAAMGGTLTAHTEPWSPAIVGDVHYVWFVDGEKIYSDEPTYVVQASDRGKSVTVTATGWAPGRLSTTSAPSAAITIALSVMKAGKISVGVTKAEVNTEVQLAKWGTWTPADATFTYQWLRNGKPIKRATQWWHFVSPSDYKKVLKLRVTASAPGYANKTVTSKGIRVIKGSISSDISRMSPVPRVGSTSKITHDAGWGPGKVTYRYQWVYKEKDGGAHNGRYARTHTFTAKDFGKEYWVHVEASAKGVTGAYIDSEHYRVKKGLFSRHPAPRIFGSKTVGSTLTVVRGKWSPTKATKFTYKWFSQTEVGARHVAIRGATSAKYTITRGQRGHLISVRITASKKVYVTKSSMSAATPEITAKK